MCALILRTFEFCLNVVYANRRVILFIEHFDNCILQLGLLIFGLCPSFFVAAVEKYTLV